MKVTKIIYLDAGGVEREAEPATVDLFGADMEPDGEWPWMGGSTKREAVRVQYEAGYAETDPRLAPIRTAILLMVGDLYRFRATVGSSTSTKIEMSTTVEALLAPYRVFA